MAHHNFSMTIVLTLAAAGAGCVVTGIAEASVDETATEASALVYPTTHPRIYLTPNRARLKAALDTSTPAAARFRGRVDAWVGGTDIWGFQAWNSALLGQLTGTASYCTK